MVGKHDSSGGNGSGEGAATCFIDPCDTAVSFFLEGSFVGEVRHRIEMWEWAIRGRD